MLALDDLSTWKKLDGPYGNSAEIPALLLDLAKTFDKEVADEIVWEYIYHQGSVYENTLASLPHLIKIIHACNDDSLKLDLTISLAIILVGFEENDLTHINALFRKNNLSLKVQDNIRFAFIDAIREFKKLVDQLLSTVKLLDDDNEKIFVTI